jgi:ubiquinone/menaquinone biosynthesis C-methylase UbiE
MLEFDWPLVDGSRPVWTGRGFQVGARLLPILDFGAGESGWTEDLTQFHEEVAGDGQHPIDLASRRHARRTLRRRLQTDPAETVILEVGCATGFLVRELMNDWAGSLIIGSDYIAGPLRRLATDIPQLPLLRFDLVQCPLSSQSVDAIVMLNVLEHIHDDRAAVYQVARVLKRGGTLVIEVPSGPHLYDAYDKYLRHYRRYRLDDLCRLVEAAGLRVIERSHLGFFVYPAFAIAKRRNRGALEASESVQRAVVTSNIVRSSTTPLLKWATAAEEVLGRWVRYPIGIRCLVAAQKT